MPLGSHNLVVVFFCPPADSVNDHMSGGLCALSKILEICLPVSLSHKLSLLVPTPRPSRTLYPCIWENFVRKARLCGALSNSFEMNGRRLLEKKMDHSGTGIACQETTNILVSSKPHAGFYGDSPHGCICSIPKYSDEVDFISHSVPWLHEHKTCAGSKLA